MTKPFYFLILLICYGSFAKAQQDTTYTPDHLYQPEALHADLAFLKSVLEEAHPSLYRYTSKDSLDKLFSIADSALNEPATEMEFLKIVEPVTAAVRSGHTVVYPSSNYIKWIYKHHANKISLAVYIANDHIYARWFPKNAARLFKGAEITSIDGLPAKQILLGLKKLTSPEGYSTQFVNFNIESGFIDLYGYAFGYKPQYDVAFIDSSGVSKHVVLNALKITYPQISPDEAKAMLAHRKSELEKSVEVNYFNSVSGAIELKIANFKYLKDYKKFDAAFFDRLKNEKIKNLIIDLRGDEGGYLNIGIDMMRYLVRNYVIPARVVTAVTNEYSFSNYIVKEGSDTLRKDLLVKAGKRTYAALNDYQFNYISAGYIFTGKVYLLIDGGTFSAASVFAANLRSQRDVTILGEESGGGEAGNDGRGFSMVRLPNTSLLLRLPQFWMSTTIHHKDMGKGVMPDVTIVPTVADKIKDNDVVLDKALHMIIENK